MIAHALFFYFFSIIAILSAIMVIVSRNTVHAVFFLILDFISIASLFILIGAEFLGMMMIIVYVGAVAVLFLFVVMLLNVSEQKLSWFRGSRKTKHIPICEGCSGSARYMSLHSHQNIFAVRRDDIESLGYILWELLEGSLPWAHKKA